MTDKKQTQTTLWARALAGDLGFMIMISIGIVTCGWSPRCTGQRTAAEEPTGLPTQTEVR